MIAKIAVASANFAIDKPYSYYVPQTMQLQPGMRVQVGFGRSNRATQGVVLSVEPGSEEGLKSVLACLDEAPMLTDFQLRMAAFLRERYFCTFFDAARTILPAGLWFHTKQTYTLTQDRSWQEKKLRNPLASQILQILLDNGGEADGQTLQRCAPSQEEFEKAVRYLHSKKWVETDTEFLRRTGDKSETVVTLAASQEEAMEYARTRPKSAAMQRAVLELMCSVGSGSVKDVCYYTGAAAATVRRLAKLGYLTLSQRPVLRCREIQPAEISGPLVLTEQQQLAFDGLCRQMTGEKPGSALLYGVTGSGKTSVYIRLIETCLEQGKQAMLLVPEIALTPQLLGLLAAYFGDEVAVLHSSLLASERYDQWKRVRDGSAPVVVGTRSAVFAPCPKVGLIILDEEQEHSYKSENAPRYDAREVALWRGMKEKALVLFGSATPAVETMYRAKTGIHTLYELPARYNGRALPKVEIVDMRREPEKGNGLSLSYDLQDAIGDVRQAKKQAILFLNRRGNSRALICVDCGQTPECPRCNTRLTYHSANERLMCHYCGFSQKASVRCSCGGALRSVGTGTQKVQQELESLFSDMETIRMDADTVSATNSHEQILNKFSQENIPVLLGTQMVAKGLNLPNVTLVGVLDGDLSLYTDNYRAGENTFNMLTQVIGRAGRGESEGRAIIQTMTPEHRVITLAAQQDYDGFYDMEIRLRQVQGCPPFGDLVAVTFIGQDEGRVLRGAAKLRDSLRACLLLPEYAQIQCTALGPAPCPVLKINYNYRYRLTLRCRMDKALRQLLAHLLRQFSQDRENRGVAAFMDVNGYE